MDTTDTWDTRDTINTWDTRGGKNLSGQIQHKGEGGAILPQENGLFLVTFQTKSHDTLMLRLFW